VNVYPSIDPRYEIPLIYDSSRLWSYEAGVRSDWRERTLRLDLTAFWLDWDDPQILQKAPGGNITSFVDNVGGARSRGLEASFRWLTPIPGLSLNEAAAYIVAKSTEAYTAIDGNEVPPGVDMPAAPRVQTATTLAYSTVFGSWLANASLLHTYMGKAWNNISHQYQIYGYTSWNLTLDVGRPDIRFQPTLTLGVANALDERGLLSYQQGGIVSPTDHIDTNYTRPRTIRLRLGASF
jgi:iron complex outermembrane recepter protein